MIGLFQNINEQLVSIILQWLPEKERFGIVAETSREMSRLVWDPENNGEVFLDFVHDSLHVRMVENFGWKKLCATVWSRVRFLCIVFRENELAMPSVEIASVLNISRLESVSLTNANSGFVWDFFANQLCDSITSIKLSNIRCESYYCLFDDNIFTKFPKLSELILDEVYFIKWFVPSPEGPSRLVSLDGDSSECESSCDEVSDLVDLHPIERIEIYLIPFGEVIQFVNEFLLQQFYCLKVLKLKCLSSVKDSQLLCPILSDRIKSLPNLEELEIGVLTPGLLAFIKRACSKVSFSKLVVPARLAVSREKLTDFFTYFSNFKFFNVRVNSNLQIEELASVFQDTHKLEELNIQWNTANGISAKSLISMRKTLGKRVKFFHVFSRNLRVQFADIDIQKSPSNEAFDEFFKELCQDRIVCECDECALSTNNPEHVLELAQEEWDELDEISRSVYYNRSY